MDLVLILGFLALFLLAFTLLIVLYKWLMKKGYRKPALLFPVIILAVVGYGAYVSLIPRDSFYVEDFEKHTGLKLPDSGKILKKYATYPDLHGEYISVALINFSSSDYQHLKKEFGRSDSLAVDTAEYPFLGNTFRFLGDSTQRANRNFAVVYKIHQSVIGFYKDDHSILFEKKK
jgi:hypothetical protein